MDEVVNFGEENQPVNAIRQPLIVFLQLFFRSFAILIYLFCNLFGGGFIGSFVVIVLLLSVDFWLIKNITGRLLVGLRWWNYIDEEGKSHWVFEAKKGRVSSVESQIFWTSLVAAPIVWLFFAFAIFFTWSIKWMMIIIIGMILNGSNLYGYIRCRMSKSDVVPGSVRNLMTAFMQRQMMQNVSSYFSRSSETAAPTNPNLGFNV